LTQLTSSSSESSSSSSSNHHDPVILSRLQAEVQKLRSEEQQILSSISSALEKENLDKSTGKDGEKKSLNSVVLSRDLEVVREKVERMMGKRAGALGQKGESSEVEEGRKGLVQCYL
jgi:altered-inheritance-of-mitochondria protein 13